MTDHNELLGTESRTMYLNAWVEFTCPADMDTLTAQRIAAGLAIRGNFDSVVEGVSLTDVELCEID